MGDSFHVRAAMQGLVVSIRAKVGETVAAGQTLVVLEAMKMEHVVTAEQSGIVKQVLVRPDAMVAAGDHRVDGTGPEVRRGELSAAIQRRAAAAAQSSGKRRPAQHETLRRCLPGRC